MSNNTLSLLSVSGDLDVSDVLSVVTSRAESLYTKRLAEAREVASQRAEDVEKARKAVANQATKEAKAAEKSKVDALREAVKALGGTVKVSVECGWNQHADELRLDDDGNLVAGVTVGSGYGSDFRVRTKPSQTLAALVTALEAAKADHAEAQKEALGWRKKLSSVPALERQYRAKLAEAKLAESEDGQAVLDLLQKDLDETLLALPTV